MGGRSMAPHRFVVARPYVAISMLLAASLAFYLAYPVHPELEKPWNYRLARAVVDITTHAGIAAEFFRFMDERLFVRSAFSMVNPNWEVDPRVKIRGEIMDGVGVRIYEKVGSEQTTGRPALIFTHGGGFMFGKPATYDILCERFVTQLDVVVFSIDYRLTPEHPSPAALHDSYAVVRHIMEHAADYDVDKHRVGVAGDSSGANLAASMSLRMRDTGEKPQFRYQVLIYPWLQGLDLTSPSYILNEPRMYSTVRTRGMALFLLSFLNQSMTYIPAVMRNMHTSPEFKAKYRHLVDWSQLPANYTRPENYQPFDFPYSDDKLSSVMEADILNPYNFPLMEESLVNLPPAYVLTVEMDTLRDEGILYAQRLAQDGVHVVHRHDMRGYHGYILNQEGPFKSDAAVESLDAVIEFMRTNQ